MKIQWGILTILLATAAQAEMKPRGAIHGGYIAYSKDRTSAIAVQSAAGDRSEQKWLHFYHQESPQSDIYALVTSGAGGLHLIAYGAERKGRYTLQRKIDLKLVGPNSDRKFHIAVLSVDGEEISSLTGELFQPVVETQSLPNTPIFLH